MRIPVINLQADKLTLATELDIICRDIGFFLVTNTGVSESIIQSLWEVNKQYFNAPLAIKSSVPMSASYPYGYSGYAQESLGGRMADPKESFCIGPLNPEAGMPMRQWPNFAGFSNAWTAYYKEMERLSLTLLAYFSVALYLPENWFAPRVSRHISALRGLNYPGGYSDFAAHAHTDYGLLTILLADQPGLQIQTRAGDWVDVPTQAGSFVVNIGDMLQRWTNNQWVSTPHRVLPVQVRRQSMAYFSNPNKETIISCIPRFCQDRPALYPPMVAGDYLLARHNQATLGG